MNATKQEIFELARQFMREWYPTLYDKPGACLYWNQVAMRALIMHGFAPMFQAGTMLWAVNNDADPNSCNAFGYCWEPEDPATLAAVMNDQLPSIHMWAVLPETGK